MNALAKFLDGAIATVSPGWAVQRAKSRAVLAWAERSYNGASLARPGLSGFRPSDTDADGAIVNDLPWLRSRSRDLIRNSPVAGSALNTQVGYVVGTGLSLKVSIDADGLGLTDEQAAAWQADTQRRYRAWAETTACDITREQTIYGLQGLAFRSALEAGDVFALLGTHDIAGREQLAVQLIEGDRCCNPDFTADTDRRTAGIERDAGGAPIRYHFSNRHPNASRLGAKFEWSSVEAFGQRTARRNVIHLFERRRPGQSRGVPYLAAVIEPIKQLQRYTDAELQAAVVAGAFAVFIKMDPDAFQDLFDDPTNRNTYLSSAMKWDGSFGASNLEGPGKAINLMPGESVEPSNPGRPNAAFDPFVMAIFRQIGMALDLPFEVLIKHYTASYSAARAALLDAWRFFNVRRDFVATYFCQPIYEAWLDWEIASGRIAAPGYFSDPLIRAAYSGAQWIGDGMGSIDPVKDVTAAEQRIALTISTREKESILYDGEEWAGKVRQLGREAQMLRDNGMPVSLAPAPPGNPASKPAANALEGGDWECS